LIKQLLKPLRPKLEKESEIQEFKLSENMIKISPIENGDLENGSSSGKMV
jgi:hypothetical protein